MTIGRIDWPSLKAAGYRVESVVSTGGRRGPCWIAYSAKTAWSGAKYNNKGDAMRACRDHADCEQSLRNSAAIRGITVDEMRRITAEQQS